MHALKCLFVVCATKNNNTACMLQNKQSNIIPNMLILSVYPAHTQEINDNELKRN